MIEILSTFNLLTFLWSASALLAFLSIVVLIVLVIRRAMFARQAQERAKRRQELTTYFQAALNSPIALEQVVLPDLTDQDTESLILIALDYVRFLQGQEAKRIVGLVQAWVPLAKLKVLLLHSRRGVQIQVLTLFGYFDDDASLDLMLSFPSDKDPYVQLAALHSLALRSAADRSAEIIESLGASNQTNALMLADVLRKFGEPALPTLHKLLVDARNARVRMACVVALGNIGSPLSVVPLQQLLKTPDSNLRAGAAAALGEIGDESAAVALANLFDDPNVDVRTKAAIALGEIGAEITLPRLIEGLNDSAWWVRFRAAEALCNFGDAGIALLRSAARLEGPAALIASQVLAEKVDA